MSDEERARAVALLSLLAEKFSVADPVLDPELHRPAERLQHIVLCSLGYIDRLLPVFELFAQMDTVVERFQSRISQEFAFMETLPDTLQGLPLHTTVMADIVSDLQLPPEQRGKAADRRAALRAVQMSFGTLKILNVMLQSELNVIRVQLGTENFEHALLLMLLQKISDTLVTGTKQVFHLKLETGTLPGEIKGLTIEWLKDHGAEKFHIPLMGTAVKLGEIIWRFIQDQDPNHNPDKLESDLNAFEMHLILAQYFSWWTDGGGESRFESLVDTCEADLMAIMEREKAVAVSCLDFIKQMDEFRSRISKLKPCDPASSSQVLPIEI